MIVRICVGLPEGSDGIYTAKVLADGLEFTRLQQTDANYFVNSDNRYEIILNLQVSGQ